jgi:hypothetical protein
VISLTQAQEVCGRLGEIIYFLDELAANVLEKSHNPFQPEKRGANLVSRSVAIPE